MFPLKLSWVSIRDSDVWHLPNAFGIAVFGLLFLVLTLSLSLLYISRIGVPSDFWPSYFVVVLIVTIVLWASAILFLVWSFRNWIHNHVGLGASNLRRASRILDSYSRDISDRNTLALAVEHAVTVATGAKDVRLLMPAQQGTWFVTVSQRTSPWQNGFQLSSMGSIVTWFRFHDDPLLRKDIGAKYLHLKVSDKGISALDKSHIEVLIPVKLREQLMAIVVIAARSSGDSYSRSDLRMLKSVAKRISTWVGHAQALATSSSQQERLEQLLGRAVRAQEEERKRLAIELHDSPVQWLTSAVYHVEACLEYLRRKNHEQVAGELEQVRNRLDRSLHELRQTAGGLRPPELERVGLVKALTRYVDIFERDTGITARCNISEAIPMLNGDLELAIYRVVQEALANTLKHSEASNVNISMGIHNNMIWTVIEDNGKGFDPENDLLIDNNHLGLAAMEERAHMLGGTLGIQSGPDCGTQITLLVPGVVFLQDSDKHYVSEKSAINNSI